MKTAVLFGARQDFGFELCSLLLEKGYEVFAIDHRDWITDKQEENWLLIGRNANVRYKELSSEEESIHQALMEEECLYIIPTIDYFNRCNINAMEQLLAQLQGFLERKSIKECLLLIHPSATERTQSSFAGKLAALIESLKKIHHVKEFCLSDILREEEPLASENEKWDNAAENTVGLHKSNISVAAKEVVSHIEQQKLLENNN